MDLTIHVLRTREYSIAADKGALQRNKLFLLVIRYTQRRADSVYKQEVDCNLQKGESRPSLFTTIQKTRRLQITKLKETNTYASTRRGFC